MRNLTLACLMLVPLSACAPLPIGVARPDRVQSEGEERAMAVAKAAMQRGGGDPIQCGDDPLQCRWYAHQMPNGTWHVSATHVWLADHNGTTAEVSDGKRCTYIVSADCKTAYLMPSE